MSAEKRLWGSKNLTGFASSPNPEVHDLETALGIHFENPPARINLTRRNRLVLLARERAIDPLRGGWAEGFYDRRYNAFFASPEANSRYTLWHENMHGYIDAVSPTNIPRILNAKDLLEARFDGQEVDPAKMERVSSGAVFTEGLSEWAAVRTGLELGTDEEVEEGERLIADVYAGGVIGSALAFDRKQLRRVTEHANIFLQTADFKGIGLRITGEFYQIIDGIRNLVYPLGFDFINQAMAELKRRGFSVASSINYLIENPPTTLNNIDDPQGYVAQKLKKD